MDRGAARIDREDRRPRGGDAFGDVVEHDAGRAGRIVVVYGARTVHICSSHTAQKDPKSDCRMMQLNSGR